MASQEQTEDGKWLVVDETTIYEVDPDCCRCLTREERMEAGIGGFPVCEVKRAGKP